MKYFAIFAFLGIVAASNNAGEEIPAHYDTADGDQLMRLLISKGFA